MILREVLLREASRVKFGMTSWSRHPLIGYLMT